MEEENVFLTAGFIDFPGDYKGALGVYDYFWMIEPEIRKKLISSWKKSLDYLEEAHLELSDIFEEEEWGAMALITDEDSIQVKPAPDNVVPFKK